MVFTPIQNWEQIAQQNIFPGESGGDYDALFGFQNRPGGQYEGVKVSQMPLWQVLQFTDPSGGYGQGVKADIGRVATPTGAYQVVGTTLRAAIKGLGLDPNMIYDEDTQDMIGQWIYENQGPGAWEGWGKGSPGGDQHGPMTASSKGGGDMNPLAYLMGGQDFPMFDPGPTKGDRWRGGLAAAGEALTALGAGHGPTFEATDAFLQGEMKRRMLQHSAQGEYGARQEATAQGEAAKNATAQWLATQGPKGEALAQAVMSGAMDGASAIAALTDPKAVLPGVDGAAPAMDQEARDKYAKDIRLELDPELKIMSATNAAITGLHSALATNNPIDIRSAVTLFSKLIDPTTGVLGGEAAAVLGSAGVIQALLDTANKEIAAGGLTDTTRNNLASAATRIAEARRKNFEANTGPLIEEARKRGLTDGELMLPEYYGQGYTSPVFLPFEPAPDLGD